MTTTPRRTASGFVAGVGSGGLPGIVRVLMVPAASSRSLRAQAQQAEDEQEGGRDEGADAA